VAEPGHFTGRVTHADGSPIEVPDAEYEITISGVTAVGEENTFKPKVSPDGTFKLRLPQGLFKPAYGTITVPFEGKKFRLWLDPVDPVEGRRESTEGIVQNFVWCQTGPKASARTPDINKPLDWFGSGIPLLAASFRNDIGQTVKPLPEGSKVVWSLKPTSKLIDGSEGKTLTVERTWRADGRELGALTDLPAANYEVSAVATLPDGSTKPLLMSDMADGRYKPAIQVFLKPNEGVHHFEYLPAQIQWAVE
jgi:hypothetical protein